MRLLQISAIACLIAVSAAPVWGMTPVGTSIVLAARADYASDVDQSDFTEASTTLTVLQKAGAAVDRDGPAEPMVAGTDNYIPLHVTNTGNGQDSFGLTIASNNGWDVVLVRDDNADGIHQPEETTVTEQTGGMVADGYLPCFARVTVPAGAVVGDVIVVTVVSNLDPQSATAEEHFALGAPERLPTSISVGAAPDSLYIGQTSTLSGAVTPSISCRVDITVTSPGGAPMLYPVDTSADGSFAFTYTTADTGEHTVTAAFAGDDCYEASTASCALQVTPKVHTSLSAAISPLQPTVGDTIEVSGSLVPAAEAVLALTCTDPDGVVTRTNVVTDAAGNYTWQISGDVTGEWEITAAYAGSASHESAGASVVFGVLVGHEISFTEGPTADPTTVPSGGTTNCSVAAVDSRGHDVAYEWSDGGAGGSFAPDASSQNPVYTAPVNVTGEDVQVSLKCTVACADPGGVGRDASVALTVQSVPLPTCTVRRPASPTNDNPIAFGIRFSEPVTGLSAASIVVSGGTKGALLGSGSVYTLSVTPGADGAVTCRVPAGAAQGTAGCLNKASNTASVTYDSTVPSVQIASPTADAACVRVGAAVRLAGVSATDTAAVEWANETTGDSGQCIGSVAWSADNVPVALGVNLISVTSTDKAGNIGKVELGITRLDVDADDLHRAWQGVSFVSLPIVPDVTDPARVVNFSGVHWSSYYGPADRYFYYPEASTMLDPLSATPGRGFSAVFDAVPEVPCGTVPSQEAPAVIHLQAGWNLVGQPFLAAVNWELDTIKVRDNASVTKLGDSEIVGHRAFGWLHSDTDPSAGEYYPICDPADDPDAAHTMPPWRAYWVLARRACDLIIEPPGGAVEQSSPGLGRGRSVQPSDLGFASDLPPAPG